MSDSLSEASAAAAEMIASGAADGAPAPEAAPAAEGEGEGADTFPRSYVEELRQEAAEYRTRAKTFEQAFEGMTEQERRSFLNLAQDLTADPERALQTLDTVASNLRNQYDPSQEVTADGRPLSPEDIERMVEERFQQRDQAAAQQQRVQEVFEEAQKIHPNYKPGSDSLVQLLHVAQTDPAAGGTLQGAHTVLMTKLEELREWAIEDYRNSLSENRAKRRPVQGGTPTTGKPVEPPKDLAEASRRAKEILGATFETPSR